MSVKLDLCKQETSSTGVIFSDQKDQYLCSLQALTVFVLCTESRGFLTSAAVKRDLESIDACAYE